MPIIRTPDIPGIAEGITAHNSVASLLLPHDEERESFSERIFLSGRASSALDLAHYLTEQGQMDVWDSVLVGAQWAGRGQLRRHWVSSPGNLFAAWRLPLVPRPWQNMVSVLVGWVLCLGLRDMGFQAELKWPNDLLLNDKKVGGILIEERGPIMLAGIGLNCISMPDESLLRKEKACVAGCLEGVPAGLSIFGLWLRLVNFGRLRYSATLSGSSPLEFSQSLETVLAYLGTPVCVADNRSSVCGVLSGVSPDGGIVLRQGRQKSVVHSGSMCPVR